MHFIKFVGIAAVFAAAQLCLAQDTIVEKRIIPAPPGQPFWQAVGSPEAVITQAGGAERVRLNVPADGLMYRIYTVDPETTDLARVTVAGNNSGYTVTVLIAGGNVTGPTPIAEFPPEDAACLTWFEGIGPDPLNPIDIKVQARILGGLSIAGSGDVNAIDVLQLIRLDIVDTIEHSDNKFRATIYHRSTTLPLHAITCSRIRNADVISYGGEIQLIRATGESDLFFPAAMGPIFTVENLDGDIGTIEAPNGLIHLNALSVGSMSSGIHATGRIDLIRARSISGNVGISTGDDVAETGGDGIHRIPVEGTEFYEGDLSANVATSRIVEDDEGNPGYIDVNRTIRSAIRLWDGLPEGAIIRAGDSLDPTGFASQIQLGTYPDVGVGLAGQVIVNGNDAGGTWDGKIAIFWDPVFGTAAFTLDPDSLSYPQDYDYPELAADLGGGAVGVVPYILYGVDAVPADGTNVTFTNRPSVANPIRVPHYGPVTYVESGGQAEPFRVYRRLICDPIEEEPGEWVDFTEWPVEDPDFQFTFAPDPNNPRLVIVTPYEDPDADDDVPFAGGYEYMIVPERDSGQSDRLQTVVTVDGATGPVVFESDEYIFSVGTACAADVNGIDGVGFDDLNYVFANWGLVSGVPGDVNNSFTIDFDDLNIILDAWEDPCTCGEEMMMMGGGGSGGGSGGGWEMPDLVAAMGFTSLEEFEAVVNGLAEEGILAEVLTGMIEKATE